MNPQTCPICGQGHLVERQDGLCFQAANVPGLRHSHCDHCLEFVTTDAQAVQNQIMIQAARSHIQPAG